MKTRPATIATCTCSLAILLTAALFAPGCSAPPVKQVVLKGTARTAPSHFYPQSLRLAARGRVQARAGDDALAAEYFRAAYQAHPDIRYLLDYARSCERARYFNEASTAFAEALTHDLTDEERKRVKGEIERLQTLIPKGEVPVTLQIRPRTAQAIVSRPADKADPRSKHFERVVMGDAKIFLRPGQYQVHVDARGFRAELRSFRVKAGSATTSQGQLVAVRLQPDEKVPLAVAQHKHHGGVPVATGGTKPTAKPAVKPAAGTAKTPDDEGGGDEGDDGDDEPKVVAGGGGEDDGEDSGETEDPGAAVDVGVSAGGGGGSSGLHKWGPIATAGVGVLALGGGAALYFMAQSEKDLAEAVDPTIRNRQELFDYHTGNAELYWNMQYIAYGVGGALVVAGTVWMALGPKRTAHSGEQRSFAEALRPSRLSFTGRALGATWRF